MRYGADAALPDGVTLTVSEIPADSEGDAITFTDMEGNIFSYQVAALEILMPTAVEEMESGDWDLTLFTCTIGGKSRVTIRCERSES